METQEGLPFLLLAHFSGAENLLFRELSVPQTRLEGAGLAFRRVFLDHTRFTISLSLGYN